MVPKATIISFLVYDHVPYSNAKQKKLLDKQTGETIKASERMSVQVSHTL